MIHVDVDGDADANSMQEGIGMIAAGGSGLLLVHAGSAPDTQPLEISGGRTVVIRPAPGESPATFSPPDDGPMVSVEGVSTLVIADFVLASHTGHPAIRAQETSFVWLEGGEIRGIQQAAAIELNSSELVLVASTVIDNDTAAISASNTSSVQIVNSFIVQNGDPSSGPGALELSDTLVDLRYNTIAHNWGAQFPSLSCGPDVSGEIRNNIFVDDDPSKPSIGSACESSPLNFAANVVDSPIPGSSNYILDDFDDGWFVEVPSDYHLSDLGAQTIGTTARWQQNDPKTDVDGDPRPDVVDSADYPGADVPSTGASSRAPRR